MTLVLVRAPQENIAPQTGRTTEAVLVCEVEQKWTWHRFAREERIQAAIGGRAIDLIFACECGGERRWGREEVRR